MPLPALRPGVLVAEMGDEAVAFEPESAMLHRLNPSAALVLVGCRHGWDARELAADVAAGSGIDVEVVAVDIDAAVEAFRAHGLVGDDGAPAAAHESDGPAGDRVLPSAPGQPAAPAGPDVPAMGIEPFVLADDALPAMREARWSRTFAVLDETVAFRSEDAAVLARVDGLFADLVAPGDPALVWDLRRTDGGAVALTGANGRATSFAALDALLRNLPTLLNGRAGASATCLALHAAAVRSPDGEVVAFPAVSGSGKSTLAAHLVQRGWDYLTDEAVALDPVSLEVLPYPKPLALDRVSRTLLGLDPDGPEAVGASELRDGAAVGPTTRWTVDRIVLVRFEPGASVLEPLAPHDAVLAVAEHVLNLRRVGAPGLDALVRLAGEVPSCRLVHGGLDDAEAALTRRGGGDASGPR